MLPKLQACADAVEAGRAAPRTSSTGASRTRCCSSCSRTRASARRWADERRPSAVRRWPIAAIELEQTFMMQTYKRLPVSSCCGEGALLYDADGRGVPRLPGRASRCCNAGHCHPHVVEAIRDQAGRLMHGLEPLLQRARRAAGGAAGDELRAGRARVPVQLRHGGQRGRDQACPQAPPRRRDRRARGRLPRPHDGRPVRDAAAGQAGAVRAAGARVRGRAARRPAALAAGRRRQDRRGDARARAGRDRRVADLGARCCWRRGTACDRARCAADLRRDPVRAWAAPARCGRSS